MKHIILLLLLPVSFSSFGKAKSNASGTTAKGRIQIGASGSFDLSYRTLTTHNESCEEAIDHLNTIEKAIPGYTGGLNASYDLKDNLSLEAGIQLSKKGYRTIFIEPAASPSPSNSIQFPTKFIYDFQYLDIPVMANYFVGKKKLRFIGSAGIVTNILIKASQTAVSVTPEGEQTKEWETPGSSYKALNLSPMISAGIDYKFNKRASLRVESIFRYGLLPLVRSTINQHLFSAGLNIGIYVRL